MDYHHYRIVCEKLLGFGRISELLTLRALCKSSCLAATRVLVAKHRTIPVCPRSSMIPMAQCMSCMKKGQMMACPRYDGRYAIFCPEKVMCRIGALISSTTRMPTSRGGFELRPVESWKGAGPFNVLRSDGSIDPEWEIKDGQWIWLPDRKEVYLYMKPRDTDDERYTVGKWCPMSDMMSVNPGMKLPPARLLFHTECSLGCVQHPMELDIIHRLEECGIEVDRCVDLAPCLSLSYLS